MTIASPPELKFHNRRFPAGVGRPLLLSTMAMILVAAASAYETNVERLRAMPAERRAGLLEKLSDFDLKLTPDQQAAVRELDRRLAAMSADQRAHYLTILRRYHAWLDTLPEQRQDELAAKAPGERIALVRNLIRERPVPTGETPSNLRIIEPGEYNPFEVASAYKIWQALDDKQQAALAQISPEPNRRKAIFQKGARFKKAVPRETIPPDFDEEKWIGELPSRLREFPAIAMLEHMAKNKVDDAVKKRVEAARPGIQRRQAINLYVSQAKVRSVDSDRLARFIAALPPWIPASFDSLSPDEARRRMTFAYRLVFPEPEEIGVIRKPVEGAANGRPAPTPKAGVPHKAKGKSSEDGATPAPF